MLNDGCKVFYKLNILLLFIAPLVANAGVFGGVDVNGNANRTWYLGAQTEEILYYGLFVGQNQYEVKDKSYMHAYMAGGIGYRWYGSWNTNFLLGFENSRVAKSGQVGSQGQRYPGLYIQFAKMKFSGDKNIEYLLSYSENSEQIWSRLRLKYFTSVGLLVGPELVVSRFLEYEYQALGVVVEKVSFPYTITSKLGIRNESEFFTLYGGLEIYRSF